MTRLSEAKLYGGLGAILGLIGGVFTLIIGIFGYIVPLAGLILVFLAVKKISEECNDNEIFRNYLLAFLLRVIGAVTFAALFLGALFALGFPLFEYSSNDYTNYSEFSANMANFFALCIIGFIILYVLYILSMIYLRKSYEKISQYTRVDLFKTAALFYLIGTVLLIVVIGALFIFIATIIEIIAFFSLPDNLPPKSYQFDINNQTGRICPNCGRPIPIDSQLCPYCGKDFRTL